MSDSSNRMDEKLLKYNVLVIFLFEHVEVLLDLLEVSLLCCLPPSTGQLKTDAACEI